MGDRSVSRSEQVLRSLEGLAFGSKTVGFRAVEVPNQVLQLILFDGDLREREVASQQHEEQHPEAL